MRTLRVPPISRPACSFSSDRLSWWSLPGEHQRRRDLPRATCAVLSESVESRTRVNRWHARPPSPWSLSSGLTLVFNHHLPPSPPRPRPSSRRVRFAPPPQQRTRTRHATSSESRPIGHRVRAQRQPVSEHEFLPSARSLPAPRLHAHLVALICDGEPAFLHRLRTLLHVPGTS